MKQIFIPIQSFAEPVECLVGCSQLDNDLVIDSGDDEDMWFHAAEVSSCHVVIRVPPDTSSSQIRYLAKAGAGLCKQHTKKLSSEKRVKFHYTCLANVSKTKIPGRVLLRDFKEITL
jgi:predicted ribosome quality control (RQC) complex YloA/Tae2 family protein